MRFLIQIWEKILHQLRENGRQAEGTNRRLDAIIELLTPPKPVKFRVSFEAGDTMNTHTHKATLGFTVFENGQATATLTPVDAVGTPTDMPTGASIPSWSPSDPSIIISASADGLSALLTAGASPVTGATVTATATLADGVTILTGVSDPFDVVAQPPGSATAFKIVIA